MFWILLTSLLSVIWSFPLFLISWSGFYLFHVADQEKVKQAINKLNGWSSIVSYNDGTFKPNGFVVGKYYFGFIYHHVEERTSKCSLFIICSKKFIQDLIMPDVNLNKEVSIKFVTISRSYWDRYYTKREYVPKFSVPTAAQSDIINKILEHYKKNEVTKVFIYGIPGTGKSTIADLLALGTQGTLCYSYDPTSPSTNLFNLYDHVKPTKENPLIILFDEFNVALKQINENKIEHKHFDIEVRNKNSYVTFMDRLNQQKYIILIMTSNDSLETINKIDSAYLRSGRVDLTFELSF